MFRFFKRKPKRIYLDNAGATPVSLRARRALWRTLSSFGNPSAIHKEGDETSLILHKARTSIANVLNAHSYEIIFTGTGTESCNLAIMGAYASTSAAKPHVITSAIEHPAVLEPIRTLEKEGKIRVTYLPAYENGIVRIKDVREALTEDTILVSVMYANNEIGTIQPVKEIGRCIDEWKKENGRTFTSFPYFHVDACQAGNYLNLDVVRLKVHLMTINSSKVYGPKGIAALYKREGISFRPLILGGGQERGWRSGTESAPLACAFAESLKESQEMKEKESERLISLRDGFLDKLKKEVPDATIYGDRGERLPNNINIRIPGIPSDEMILRLDAEGFAVSHKSACASQETDGSYVVQALGATVEESLENVRVTLGRETRREDLDNLVKAIVRIKGKFAR